jgi:hypothetical protein
VARAWPAHGSAGSGIQRGGKLGGKSMEQGAHERGQRARRLTRGSERAESDCRGMARRVAAAARESFAGNLVQQRKWRGEA